MEVGQKVRVNESWKQVVGVITSINGAITVVGAEVMEFHPKPVKFTFTHTDDITVLDEAAWANYAKIEPSLSYPQPLALYSPNESAMTGGSGFWNAEYNEWVEDEEATRYSLDQVAQVYQDMESISSLGGDVRFVVI